MIQKFEVIFADLMKKVDIRPYDKDDKRDGNFNYIHQQYVADAMVKVRELIKGAEKPKVKEPKFLCFNAKCEWHADKNTCLEIYAKALNNCTGRIKEDPNINPCYSCPNDKCDYSYDFHCPIYRKWREK